MKRVAITLLSLTLSAGLTACTPKDQGTAAASSTTDPTSPVSPPSTPVVSVQKPFALKMYTVYDNTEYVNNLTFQETGTTECSVSDATPVVTCTVIIPEGRLYFSKLFFTYAWAQQKCTLMQFQPYFYLSSLSSGYVPPGADAPIDCSLKPTPIGCFSGAAVDMVADFPKKKSFIYTPDETDPTKLLSDTQFAKSAYSHTWGSNRWTVNDMPNAKIGTAATAAQLDTGDIYPRPPPGDAYVGFQGTAPNRDPEYYNYIFECRDHWYDPQTYVINVNVRKEDSKTGNTPEDDWFSWKEWP